ncbi:MAG: hypothetical protein Q7R76_06695 [Candidatus Woesearchaeota archaeon]|nr:hypothetical protein [Candidatus Woesearchaeota archaeon]
MNWTKLISVLIIVLLYIPMVFLGANVFFPQYTGTHSYYQPSIDCYNKYPYPARPEDGTEALRGDISEKQRVCQQQNQQEQEKWEQEKLQYEGTKYVFITLFNLVVLLGAVFIPALKDSVSMGLFLGSIATTFGATIRYFDTRSKLGFIILVVTFLLMVYFINKKKDTFINWKGK